MTFTRRDQRKVAPPTAFTTATKALCDEEEPYELVYLTGSFLNIFLKVSRDSTSRCPLYLVIINQGQLHIVRCMRGFCCPPPRPNDHARPVAILMRYPTLDTHDTRRFAVLVLEESAQVKANKISLQDQ
jgi:hypothetical protein